MLYTLFLLTNLGRRDVKIGCSDQKNGFGLQFGYVGRTVSGIYEDAVVVQYGLILPPAGEDGKVILPDDKREGVLGVCLAKLAQGVRGIGRAGEVELKI